MHEFERSMYNVTTARSMDNSSVDQLNCVVPTEPAADEVFILLQVVIVIVWMVGIPGNVLSIAAVLRFKKLRTAGNIYVTNLSISDSLYYTLSLPIRFTLFRIGQGGIPFFDDHNLLCTFIGGLSHFLNGSSVLCLSAIALNRLLLIQHSRFYKRMYNRRGLAMQIATIWFSSFTITLALPLSGAWGGYEYHAPVRSCTLRPCNDRIFKIIIVTIGFWIPASFIGVCYTLIYKQYRESQKRVKTWNRKSSSNTVDIGGSVTDRSDINSTSMEEDHTSMSNYRRGLALDRNARNKGNSVILEEYISEVKNQITEKNFVDNDSLDSVRVRLASTDPCASLLSNGRRLSTLSETSISRSNSLTLTSNDTIRDELILNSSKLSSDNNCEVNGDQNENSENQKQYTPILKETIKPQTLNQTKVKKVAFEERPIERPPILVRNRNEKRQSNASTSSRFSFISTRSRIKKVKFVLTSKQHKEAIIMSFMMLCIFVLFSICILPYFTVIVVNPNMEDPDAYLIALMFTWFNGCINPAIYALMNTQYRGAYRALLKSWFGWMYCCRLYRRRRRKSKTEPMGNGDEHLHHTATHF